MKNGQFAEAYECLHEILIGEAVIPEPMLYYVFCDLEICCKEIDNFKGAYEYSVGKVDLLEHMLREDPL